MKNIITILAVCFSIATATAQDTKPTLEETRDYINKIWRALPELKFSETRCFDPRYSKNFGYGNSWENSDSCNYLSCRKDYARYSILYEFEPENFVEAVEVTDWSFKTNGIEIGAVALTANAKTIRVKEVGFDSWDTCQLDNTDKLFFFYNKSNPGEMERLLKALNHYVKLVKLTVKPDPFAN